MKARNIPHYEGPFQKVGIPIKSSETLFILETSVHFGLHIWFTFVHFSHSGISPLPWRYLVLASIYTATRIMGLKRGGKGKESLGMTVSHLLSKIVPFLIILSNSPLSTTLYGFTSEGLTAWCVILAALTGLILQKRFQCRRLVALWSVFHFFLHHGTDRFMLCRWIALVGDRVAELSTEG